MKKFLGKLTKETLTIALAFGVGLAVYLFGKLGASVAIAALAFYVFKKGAIDKVIDGIMKSIPGAGVPPPKLDEDEEDKG